MSRPSHTPRGRLRLAVISLLALLAAVPVRAGGPNVDAVRWIERAVHPDDAVADPAIAALRGLGPAGLDMLLARHVGSGTAPASAPGLPDIAPAPRVRRAIDAVAAQKDAHVSRLYWYTDLERARQAAMTSGRPILSLRLLGRLDEELSCANSRFFRTTLYANEGVVDSLRRDFVLHWQSMRPVPRFMVDFGDGRRLQGTITGNSVHYVLDARGRFIDALPGLYGPRAFLRGLGPARAAALETASAPDDAYRSARRRFHAERLAVLEAAWTGDLARLEAQAPPASARVAAGGPGAVAASALAVGKRRLEAPLLEERPAPAVASDDLWARLAGLHAADAVLDARSRRLMSAKHPTAREAARVAFSKADIEDPMLRVISGFQRSIAEDTVRNEYHLHRCLHEWLAGRSGDDLDGRALASFDARIYAELFLSPLDDPWAGLAPADVFTALPGRGIVDG